MMSTITHTKQSACPPKGYDDVDMEKTLVRGLRNKDQKVLSCLYEMYAAALKGVIGRIIAHDEITEDLLQETFVKIWNSFHQYQDNKGRLFTWMSTLARNVALDQLRRKSHINSNKHVDLGETVAEVDVLKTSNYNIDTIGLRSLMRMLSPMHRAVLNLVYFEGYTHTEVAESLNLPLGTVKSRIRFALIEMRKFF